MSRSCAAKRESVAEINAVARELRTITSSTDVPLIINDYAQIARDVGADGVHVGQDDIAIAEVRKILGPYGFVGKSTHSLEQAKAAQAEGADYIGFGPLFATPTKPDYTPIGLEEIQAPRMNSLGYRSFASAESSWKIFARVIAAGAQRVVIVSGLLQSGRCCRVCARGQSSLSASDNRNSKI